jgi:Tfp pilus assembly protein PilN
MSKFSIDKVKFLIKKKKNKKIKISNKALKDFNLLYAYQSAGKKDELTLKVVGSVIGIEVAVFAIVSTILGITSYRIKVENAKIEEEIRKNSYIEEKIKKYNAVKAAYEEKEAVCNVIASKNETILETLKIIGQVMPKEMSSDSININGDKISMIIKSSREENIAQFISNLQDTERFKNIVISGISNDNMYKKTTINAEIVRK